MGDRLSRALWLLSDKDEGRLPLDVPGVLNSEVPGGCMGGLGCPLAPRCAAEDRSEGALCLGDLSACIKEIFTACGGLGHLVKRVG